MNEKMKKRTEQLIKYAEALGTLTTVTDSETDEYQLSVGGAVSCYSKTADGKKALYTALRRAYPITEVIDLVTEALKSRVLREVAMDTDDADGDGESSVGSAFVDFKNDYLEICRSKKVFVFAFVSAEAEDRHFKVVFSPDVQDDAGGIEYAHRGSDFVDLLLRQIFGGYSMLYAQKTRTASGTVINTEPPIDGLFQFVGRRTVAENENANEMVAQIKLLIRYRDTVGGDVFAENITDDIFLRVTPSGVREWSFPDFVFDEAVNGYERVKDISQKDQQKMEKILDIIRTEGARKDMFTVLKGHRDSELYRVVAERKTVYDDYVKKFEAFGKNENSTGVTNGPVAFVSNEPAVKVEYSVTPLAVYYSDTVMKTVNYKLKYRNGVKIENSELKDSYESLRVGYSMSFTGEAVNEYRVERDGKSYVLSEENPLVIAFDGDIGDGSVPVVTCKACVTDLYSENSGFYQKAYQNIYFLNSAITVDSYNGIPIADKYKGKKFLKTDLRKCEVDGHAVYYPKKMVNVIASDTPGEEKYVPKPEYL